MIVDIEGRLALVRGRIARAAARAGRAPEAVTLIAVTKTMPAATVRAAALAGIGDVGENRVQEAQEKIGQLGDLQLRWHLVGHLQRNKARRAVGCFDAIHSIDTLELAQAVARFATEAGKRVEAFVQVNVSGEASKSGFSPEAFRRHAADLARLAGVRWRGLMTMAPEGADPAALRALFAATRRLHEEARGRFGAGWDALSMGMTDDFEIAIEEGATHVRIGRAIFGERVAAISAEGL
jgi:pyridoxal phosphate enzyme (YggS family)